MTDVRKKTTWPFKVIEGGKEESHRRFVDQVSELLDHPDGQQAWQKLKALARSRRQAANSPLAIVQSSLPEA